MTSAKRPRRNRSSYFEWLSQLIGNRGQSRDCYDFISDLHSYDFYSLIPNDENRALDGIGLRERFIDETGIEAPNGSCTLLEMLIALAERLDFVLYSPDSGEDRRERWFWLLINNLGLQKYNCDDPNRTRKERINRGIIQKFLERQYSDTGRGGLFPLNDPIKDQREVEIWYQMMYYVEENYEF